MMTMSPGTRLETKDGTVLYVCGDDEHASDTKLVKDGDVLRGPDGTSYTVGDGERVTLIADGAGPNTGQTVGLALTATTASKSTPATVTTGH